MREEGKKKERKAAADSTVHRERERERETRERERERERERKKERKKEGVSYEEYYEHGYEREKITGERIKSSSYFHAHLILPTQTQNSPPLVPSGIFLWWILLFVDMNMQNKKQEGGQ